LNSETSASVRLVLALLVLLLALALDELLLQQVVAPVDGQ
jgi:hypothetical protein